MSQKTVKCACCSKEDEQKYSEIANIIDLYKDNEGSLIQILHLAQGIYGYLPLDLQKFIASSLDKPLSEVSGRYHILFLFLHNTPGGTYDTGVPRDRLLCQRRQEAGGASPGNPEYSNRRNDTGWEIHLRNRTMHRSMRTCACHDDRQCGVQAGECEQAGVHSFKILKRRR